MLVSKGLIGRVREQLVEHCTPQEVLFKSVQSCMPIPTLQSNSSM